MLKRPPIKIILKLLNLVLELSKANSVDSLMTLDINLAFSHAQTLALIILIPSIPQTFFIL